LAENGGPRPWESKELLTGLVALVGYIAFKLGVPLSAEDALAIATTLMIFFRVFANQGQIRWR
jgi:hypothetical protein